MWGTAAALALTLLIALTLIAVVMINGLGVFWPASLDHLELKDGGKLVGELIKREPAANGEGYRRQYKIGNRDLYSLDFRWVDEIDIVATSRPAEIVALERLEYGNFYGRLLEVRLGDLVTADAGAAPMAALLTALDSLQPLRTALRAADEELSDLSYRSEQVRRQILKLTHQGRPDTDPAIAELERQRGIHKDDFNHVMATPGGRPRQAAQLLGGVRRRQRPQQGDPAGRDRPHLPAEHHVGLEQECAFTW